jgi:hypothetical protein
MASSEERSSKQPLKTCYCLARASGGIKGSAGRLDSLGFSESSSAVYCGRYHTRSFKAPLTPRLRRPQQPGNALVFGPDAFFYIRRAHIAVLALRRDVPTVFDDRAYVEAGGLICYGADFLNVMELAGNYVGQILKGEKPADLPVQQPTKFELVINLKTAKALGLTVPPSLLARADEVIE